MTEAARPLDATSLIWDSGEDYSGRAWTDRLTMLILAAPFYLAFVVAGIMYPGTFASIPAKAFVAGYVALGLWAVFWRDVGIQQVSVSAEGLHVVAWISRFLGGRHHRIDRHVAADSVLSVDAYHSEMEGVVIHGVRITMASEGDLGRSIWMDRAAEGDAETFAGRCRAILGLAAAGKTLADS